MIDPKRYPAKVFWNDEDDGFIAIAPDLPGCSAFGQSEAEAISELRHAMVAWEEAAKAAGNPIPEPSKETRASGKFLLRMPRALHQSVIDAADFEGVSVNQHLVYLISASSACRSISQMCAETFDAIKPMFAYGMQSQSKVVGDGQRYLLFFDSPSKSANTYMPSAGAAVSNRTYLALHRS